ncbi:MAG TPA: methionine--tRNA ligase [Candidatus Saccharimonadales bacterium]|nr:methionine--tRNA ligase [Candidatus Saccharimonadales bacterium]
MTKKYISTSIAYINAEPHIGFLFELVAADVLARFQRQTGHDVFFLTGTDEHGTKVEQAAKAAGQEPQQFADQLSAKFQALGQEFAISSDYFIRTTDQAHIEFVTRAWEKLAQQGVIVKKSYEGFYCAGCEAFKTEKEIVEGECAIHQTPVEKISEENYFLLITEPVKDRIRAWAKEAIKPGNRVSEVLNVLEELNEVSASRPVEKLQWGIPVPGDASQVIYVWIDALLDYLSGIEAAGQKIEDSWPGIQLIGKDILKFHAIIWPAMLLALGYELPHRLIVHGWINFGGQKLSKSTGNVILPSELKARYGVDGTRYLLLRQLNFYDDSHFSWEEFDALYNGELANGIGNLVARVVGLLKKINRPVKAELKVASQDLAVADFAGALKAINDEVNAADQAISALKLWENITEDEEKQKELVVVAEKVAALADLLEPFTPSTSQEIRRQLAELDPKPLFPRLNF